MAAKKGKLIVIDGIDGSGKATQTKLLYQKLVDYGLPVKTLDFPQYTQNFFGGLVRQYLDGKFGVATEIDPHLASVLYAADRWESSKKINDWLAAGNIVLLDRYYTSNLIHQSTKLPAEKIDEFVTWVIRMEIETFKIPSPDAVLFLHMPPAVALSLITKRGAGHDGHENLDHLKLAEQRCLYLANKLAWTVVECSKETQPLAIENISQTVWSTIEPMIDS